MGALCYRRKGSADRKCVSHLFSRNRQFWNSLLRCCFCLFSSSEIRYLDSPSPAGVLLIVITAHEESHDLASRAPAQPTHAPDQTCFIFKCHADSCVESGYYILRHGCQCGRIGSGCELRACPFTIVRSFQGFNAALDSSAQPPRCIRIVVDGPFPKVPQRPRAGIMQASVTVQR